jgi:tRNA(fMet)-specific endonuclease VapC
MTVQFMLDTDTVSFALRGEGGVSRRILAYRSSALCISAITLGELLYGAARVRSNRIERSIFDFVGRINVMPFDEACAFHYARIASDLAERGERIGELDTMIAAHALTLDLTLVTNNVRHFTRVQNLKVENWA